MIKAIIWDMDGTLVDSEKHHINAEVASLKKFGLDITHEIAKKYMGLTLPAYLKELEKEFGVDLPVEEIEAEHQHVIKKYYAEVLPLVPYAEEVLAELDSQYLQGLGTSSYRENAENVLKRHGVWKYFKAVCCGNDVPHGKPAPDIFLKVAEDLGVKPEECVVIEDSGNGMRAARAAGMKVIARRAAHNSHVDFSMADAVVESLTDVGEEI